MTMRPIHPCLLVVDRPVSKLIVFDIEWIIINMSFVAMIGDVNRVANRNH